MSSRGRVEELLARYIHHHVMTGTRLELGTLCEDEPGLLASLESHVRRYEQLEHTLDIETEEQAAPPPDRNRLPRFTGFRTIERVGGGGGGDVFKLEDLELGRTVAAKIVRPDNPLNATLDDFLREARSLALFDDPRIVRIFEFRRGSDPPALLMEYVDGFELDRIGPSLEYRQRARVMAEIADTLHRAHRLGIQHRDLKPANILVDAELSPKILDFGLSRGEPDQGHGKGTPAYMAPEQLDPGRSIDARTDVYALGVIFYELLCGARPHSDEDRARLLQAIREGRPRLPVEVQPDVPEPLQAIALKAMEPSPDDRYGDAREMMLDLRRYLDGRPVLARPTLYRSALQRRLRPHLEQIREWVRIKLVYPHEAEELTAAYQGLEAREDDWIFHGRFLSLSQIVLYLGVFLIVAGSLLYFVAHVEEAVTGILGPAFVLVVPFAALNFTAWWLQQRERRDVAVAFRLAAVVLLPMFLLILFRELGIWPANPDDELELFGGAVASNRQMQVAALAAVAWSVWLALGTRTIALSTAFTAMALAFYLSVLTDLGLRSWLEDGRFDRLGAHLVPFLLGVVLGGRVAEARGRSWLARPLYLCGALLFVISFELMALDGRAFEHLGVTMRSLQPTEVSDPTLLDTVAAMTLNGLVFYLVAWLLASRGGHVARSSAQLLYTIAPFAILQPLAWLNHVGEYSRRFDWIYLALALGITLASHFRQRRSFYYAGILNTGFAVWYITSHYEWWDRPVWGIAIVILGIVALAAGFGLATRERTLRGGDDS